MAGNEATGTWEDVFGASPPAIATLANDVRARIRAVHGAAVEMARPGERTVCFGHGPRKMTEAYAYLMPAAAHVTLGFFHGVALPDPDGLLEGSGKRLRHVKVTPSLIANPGIERLLHHAVEERRAFLADAAATAGGTAA